MSLPTESYAAQSRRWPTEGEHVLARFDDESIIVYQAYRPSIGRYAIEHGRLGGPDFSFQRMSWVKPNFLWMMYRSGWGTKGGKRSRWACASSALSSIGSWPKRTVLVRGVGHPGSRRLG